MLKNLLSPINIGNMELKNRFVVTAMASLLCNADGSVTEKFIAYHEAKARGGWGLIITENFYAEPRGKSFPTLAGLHSDKLIEGHVKLTDLIHKHGGKIVAQIYHCGRQTTKTLTGMTPAAPSAMFDAMYQEEVHELSIEEIHDLVDKFGNLALRAKKAGYDGVEIHGAHGYLISEFLSPFVNKRTDEYGGTFYNRARFLLEIIADIREKVGDDFPILLRISGEELVPGGRTIEDTKAIAMLVEQAGVDAIDVSVGISGVTSSRTKIIPPQSVGHGWNTDWSAEIKKVVNIPVIAAGRINDPLLAESVLASGKADLIGMGRASLADPDMPNKVMDGRFDEINHCIACMQGCAGGLQSKGHIGCFVNPVTGQETELVIEQTNSVKKVIIVGGGCAGMEAAIVAAKKGHDVHLYEKTNELGGQYLIASVPPAKGEFASFTVWQKNQLEKLGVNIHLNSEVTEEIINNEKPDAVIVATGAVSITPNISGVDSPNVYSGHDVLKGNVSLGRNVIVIGGGMVGSEIANHLAVHEKNVRIVEMMSVVAKDEVQPVRMFMMEEFKKNGVEIFVNAKVKEIVEDGVIITRDNVDEKLGGADSIVLALGAKSVDNLSVKIKDKVKTITIGDALKARKALDAIEEGYRAALII